MKLIIQKASAEDYATLWFLFDEVDSLHRENLPHIFKIADGPVRELD